MCCYLHWRHKAIHVVASVAIIAEQQLVIVLASTTQCAGLALDTLQQTNQKSVFTVSTNQRRALTCHGYFLTLMSMLSVNWRQVG